MARGSIQRRGDAWTAIVDLPPDPATGATATETGDQTHPA